MEWDPIGIRNIPEAKAEYDAYVPSLCLLLRRSQSITEIYKYLCWIEVDRMGLDLNEVNTMMIAKKLILLATRFE